MVPNYPETISALSHTQRLYFYELFAHFLTVSMRGVLFFEGIPNSERVERSKWLNEIAHRITYQVFLLQKNQARRTEIDIWEMIAKNVRKNPAIEADVNSAVELSINYIKDHESDSFQQVESY